MNASLIWFRDDLRVADNPALLAAVADGAAAALYVLDEESAGIRPLGGAAKWWLHHALADLHTELAGLGIPLILRRGPGAEVAARVAGELGAGAVYWNRRYGGPERAVDTAVKEWAGAAGLHAESFQASLLHEPWTVRTGAGNPYQVFTPFWKALSANDFRAPLDVPDAGRGYGGTLPESDSLEGWALLPTAPDWAAGLREAWTPTAAAGHEALAEFLEDRVAEYSEARDRPDRHGTSHMSPYLRWGQLSPFQVWAALAERREQLSGTVGPAVYAAELGWREFCWHQLYHHPDLATNNLRPQFDHFPWRRPDADVANHGGGRTGVEHLHAWQQGRTGIPLVDAGQRELWHTGYMHNRVRMVAASFLVKNLGIHWRAGEQWFWDTLVDADAASNPANWQWVAGSGADASPFFRIFNPLTQAKKFDPSGAYVNRWVPEWLTPEYPQPMVDLQETRREALDAYGSIKERLKL
ncbi:deoxyribodipyrimidine photolyase [Arthrobacter sp. ERGS1:01]|uniref:cryptochrome/photolyase family protein n=1 Tax=Arthrobacter sp. ERGS1:01 TaxID=1704044 RepID=UPI0006B4B15D|nr:deoxyribodipyrimidine photo-lyase [Arthrobacter sp. ERGS1:01]ALE06487.1 deoxyribodipyrimidine photolyase [Arthrobacter sp. ERGS1:01]